jgi:hypothetical protein
MRGNEIFNKEESDLILSTLIRAAVLFGYKPDRRIFFRKGKWQAIRELRDYIFSRLEPMIEDEVKGVISWFVKGVGNERMP